MALNYKRKKDLLEHVLSRPSIYLGSCELEKRSEFVVELNRIVQKKVELCPGFLRIFIEILSNAIDNVWRSKEFGITPSKIELTLTSNNSLSIYNDGMTIPVEKGKEEGTTEYYLPELVFGIFMTSSNYNDDEERKTSGLNGLGAKLTNAFSTFFEVETQDEKHHFHYLQRWQDNMKVRSPPLISKRQSRGFTKVSWIPDFSKFNLCGYTDDHLSILFRYMYDCAMITQVPTFINGEKIQINSLKDYALHYIKDGNELACFHSEDSDVVLVPSKSPFFVCFTNGILNSEGGVHVEAWAKKIFSSIAARLTPSKSEGIKLTSKDVRQFFGIFVKCDLVRPVFSSQSKEKLISPKPSVKVPIKVISSIIKWSTTRSIKELIDVKRYKLLKNLNAKKKFVNVEYLEDANLAGKVPEKCTLIICEGLSARTYAVTGIETGIDGVKGRDYFGVYPLGGKILNVRNVSKDRISKNRQVSGLIQALGLQIGVDYQTNHSTLRYHKVLIIADADMDGIHIEGLCQNFFHKLFPSLLRIQFFYSMRTPIVRVYLRGGEVRPFYRMKGLKEFLNEALHVVKVKYFKGLGSSEDTDIINSFGKRIVEYREDEETDTSFQKAFGKFNTDQRKKWIEEFTEHREQEEGDARIVTSYSQFINNELILFSIANCKRSLPSAIDGLKESQRKILYTCFKRKLKKSSLKVIRLAGAVGEETEYHYGEQCLWDTIIGMAWDFVGSNNAPLLYREGQFGSRLSGGKDASSARYISTRLEKITSLIFREEDEPLLTYLQGEEISVEPEFYIPILPVILINGCRGGIGTGWSCTVPCFNPLEIVECLKIWIKMEGKIREKNGGIVFESLPKLTPWYKGYKGEIQETKQGVFTSYGIVEEEGSKQHITELPIGYWTDKLLEKLKEMKKNKEIKNFVNHSSKAKVDFIVSGLEKKFQFSENLSTNNMVLFTREGRIHRYENIDEIIDEFAQVRLCYYVLRKQSQLEELRKRSVHERNKRNFIQEIIDGSIILSKTSKKEVSDKLNEKNYHTENDGYDYLLRMRLDSLTKEKVIELDEKIQKLDKETTTLENTLPQDIWIRELNEFSAEYINN